MQIDLIQGNGITQIIHERADTTEAMWFFLCIKGKCATDLPLSKLNYSLLEITWGCLCATIWLVGIGVEIQVIYVNNIYGVETDKK